MRKAFATMLTPHPRINKWQVYTINVASEVIDEAAYAAQPLLFV